MKEKFEFETPMLEEAKFGQFIAGSSSGTTLPESPDEDGGDE